MVTGTVMLARHTAGTTERGLFATSVLLLAAAAVGTAVLVVVGRRR